MEKWLKDNFNIIQRENEESKKLDYIKWGTNSCSVNFILNTFGEDKLTKTEMLEKTPTEGWESIIEKWDELGKFE